MCTDADAVAASKGFWAEMLGVGDFYYEVSSFVCIPLCLCFMSRS